MLYIFWSGHGYLEKGITKRRKLLYKNTGINNDQKNLDILSFLGALQESGKNQSEQSGQFPGFKYQIGFIDACADYPFSNPESEHYWNLKSEKDSDKFLSNVISTDDKVQHNQFILFAAAEGHRTGNDKKIRRGIFSQKILTLLEELPPDRWWDADGKFEIWLKLKTLLPKSPPALLTHGSFWGECDINEIDQQLSSQSIDALVESIRRYLSRDAGYFERIKTITMMRIHRPVPLEKIYIDLDVLAGVSSDISFSQAARRQIQKEQYIKNPLKLFEDMRTPNPAMDMIRNNRKLIVFGLPGT